MDTLKMLTCTSDFTSATLLNMVYTGKVMRDATGSSLSVYVGLIRLK